MTHKEDSSLEAAEVAEAELIPYVSRRLYKEFDNFIYGGHEAYVPRKPYMNINSMGSASGILQPEPGTLLDMTSEEVNKMMQFIIDKLPPALFKDGKDNVTVLKEFLANL